MEKLLTKKDLADRWQVTEASIDNWRKNGVIPQCKGLPIIRFSLEQIQELEGIQLDRYSPLLRRKHELEIERLQAELQKKDKKIEELKAVIAHVQVICTKEIYDLDKE